MLLPENVKILPFTFFSPQNHYGLFFWGNARYLIVYKSYKKSQDSLHVPIYSAFKRWNILKLREIANTNTLELVNAGTCILRPTCLLRPNMKVPIYTCIHVSKLDTKTTCPLRPF